MPISLPPAVIAANIGAPPGTGGGSLTEEVEQETTTSTSFTGSDLYQALKDQFVADFEIASSYADNAARRVFETFNQNVGRYPNSLSEVLGTSTYLNVGQFYASGAYNLPPTFTTDGTTYINDPAGGMMPFNPAAGPSGVITGVGLTPDQLSGGRSPLIGPNLSTDQIGALLGLSRRSGGGSGGGGGRQAPVFDEAQLKEGAREIWRGMLLEEPANLDGLVKGFMSQATAFARKGGSLDFQTYVLGEARKAARYKTLYGKKPESMGEPEYLAQYVAPVRALGLRESQAMPIIEQGAANAPGLAGFNEGLERQTAVQSANQGKFSQRFAALVSQLGVKGT